jgi:uncharacterized membrane-anchored protein YhcB (DUF1043 family)
MSWQEMGVALIVGGAVAFLVLRVAGRRRRRKPAQTFVPLTSVKHRRNEPRGDSGCH